MKEMWCY